MNIDEIVKCPNCQSDKLVKNGKKYLICDDCKSKIGITNNSVWYEYNYVSEKMN